MIHTFRSRRNAGFSGATGGRNDKDGLNEDGVADYADYSVSLKADQTGVIAGTGGCTDLQGMPTLPDVYVGDVVDIGVLTPAILEEFRPVLMGGF